MPPDCYRRTSGSHTAMTGVQIILLLTLSFQQFIPIALTTSGSDHSSHANLEVPDSGGGSGFSLKRPRELLESMEASTVEETEAGEARQASSQSVPQFRFETRDSLEHSLVEYDSSSDDEDEDDKFDKSRSLSPSSPSLGGESPGMLRSKSPLLSLGGISLASHCSSPSPRLPEHSLSLRPHSMSAVLSNKITEHGHTAETDEKMNTERKFFFSFYMLQLHFTSNADYKISN